MTKMTEAQIAISTEHLVQLRGALNAALPRECCGILLGENSCDRLSVKRILNTLNTKATIGGFTIPDHEIRRVRWLSQHYEEPIIAVFHSHPDGSGALSEPDRRSLAYSEWPWVVITPRGKSAIVDLWYYKNGLNHAHT